MTILRPRPIHVSVILGTFVLLAIVGSVSFLHSDNKKEGSLQETNVPETYGQREKRVMVYLDTMQLMLEDGSTTVTIPLISKGRPGSYFETIGGNYASDYKEEKHFSSIGHVYMPWSVHVFGNFFIHGIPYYEDGKEVSSTYSGGCVRVTSEDAKKVYDFVQPGTPIIIVQSDAQEFKPLSTSSSHLSSMDMTRLMVATISLEFLNQDNGIIGPDGTITTHRKLLPELIIDHNDSIAERYASDYGTSKFIAAMNAKAQSLGLTNTVFDSVTEPAHTSDADQKRFTSYITAYTSYLLTLTATSTRN